MLVNGGPIGFFESSRGLGQSNMLLPYLFFLAMGVLHCLFNRVKKRRCFSGFKVVDIIGEGSKVSHFLLFDDI